MSSPSFPFLSLPPEVQEQVLLRADARTLLLSCRRVCKDWDRHINRRDFWVEYIKTNRLVPPPALPLVSSRPWHHPYYDVHLRRYLHPAVSLSVRQGNPFWHNLVRNGSGEEHEDNDKNRRQSPSLPLSPRQSRYKHWVILRGLIEGGWRIVQDDSGEESRWFATSSLSCFKEQTILIDVAFCGLLPDLVRMPENELLLEVSERVAFNDEAKEKNEEEQAVYELIISLGNNGNKRREMKIRYNGRQLLRRRDDSGAVSVCGSFVLSSRFRDRLVVGHGGMGVKMRGMDIRASIRRREKRQERKRHWREDNDEAEEVLMSENEDALTDDGGE